MNYFRNVLITMAVFSMSLELGAQNCEEWRRLEALCDNCEISSIYSYKQQLYVGGRNTAHRLENDQFVPLPNIYFNGVIVDKIGDKSPYSSVNFSEVNDLLIVSGYGIRTGSSQNIMGWDGNVWKTYGTGHPDYQIFQQVEGITQVIDLQNGNGEEEDMYALYPWKRDTVVDNVNQAKFLSGSSFDGNSWEPHAKGIDNVLFNSDARVTYNALINYNRGAYIFGSEYFSGNNGGEKKGRLLAAKFNPLDRGWEIDKTLSLINDNYVQVNGAFEWQEKLLIYGSMKGVNNIETFGIVGYDGNNFSAFPRINMELPSVIDMEMFEGKLYVIARDLEGDFTAPARVYKLNESAGNWAEVNIDENVSFRKFAVSESSLYVLGLNGAEEEIWMIGCDVTTNVENEDIEESLTNNSIVDQTLNLSFKKPIEGDITIYNGVGKVIAHNSIVGSEFSFDAGSLTPGIYFYHCKIDGRGETLKRKFIKK